MGGIPKGTLRLPDGRTLVQRWIDLCGALNLACVLVGNGADYDAVGVSRILDDPRAHGPLAGVLAAIEGVTTPNVVVVACDMPYVSDGLMQALCSAPEAVAIAGRVGGRWEPMFARYDVVRARQHAIEAAARGAFSLRGLLDELGAVPLDVPEEQAWELWDWDEPGDLNLGTACARP